jgi:hypothetical protein
VTLLPSTTTLSNVSPTTVTHGQAVSFTATVKPSSGTGTPTGLVSLEGGPTNSGEGIAGFTLASGAVSGSTELLPGGTYSLKAHYPGDSTYGPSDSSPVTVTVNKENSMPQVFLVTFDSNGGIVNGSTNTASYGSPYILRANVENAAGQMCAPVATTGATACPSGDVALTNNGTALDAGTYVLNTDGYVEDLTVQLPGGTNSVKAAYAGDSSFNASTVTTAITITPAATTMTAPALLTSATVGQSATFNAYINTTSSGLGPTGTVTFYANGTAIGGTLSVVPISGGPTSFASALVRELYDNGELRGRLQLRRFYIFGDHVLGAVSRTIDNRNSKPANYIAGRNGDRRRTCGHNGHDAQSDRDSHVCKRPDGSNAGRPDPMHRHEGQLGKRCVSGLRKLCSQHVDNGRREIQRRHQLPCLK